MGNDLDLAVGRGGDDNVVAQVVGAAVNLDVVLEELLEGGDVEDLVAGRLRSVDDELLGLLLGLARLLLYHDILNQPTAFFGYFFFSLRRRQFPSSTLNHLPKRKEIEESKGIHVRLQQSDSSNVIPSNTYSDGSHC